VLFWCKLDKMTLSECWGNYSSAEGVVQIGAIQCVLMAVLQIAIRLAGIATFIMLLVGGFKYLTAGGDPKKAESANATLTYAVIGLAVLIGSWFILLLIQKITGVNITQFDVTQIDVRSF